MNYLTTIANMNSMPELPFEELLHSETNTDEEVKIDDNELEALIDDNIN